MAACLHFSYCCVWIPMEENVCADAASRFQFSKLFQVAPHLFQKSSSTKSQLTGLRCTLISLNVLLLTSGMGWHPALGKHIHQVSAHTSTSLGSAPFSSMPLVSISQPLALESWNGSRHLVIMPLCPKPLNPTSPVFVPCTLTLVCCLNVASLPQSSASSEASSIFMEKGFALPNCPSHLLYSRSSLRFPRTLVSETTSISTLQSSLLGQDSYNVGSLQSPTEKVLTPQSISLRFQSSSSLTSRTQHMSVSHYPPQKLIHFGRVSQFW
jgi:hypothetical protein